jgi:uncharacterized protein (TIGR00730 family)
MPLPRSVCVFCGSRLGNRDSYAAAATAVGRLIAGQGWRLVFGAGEIGLMGRAAEAAKAAGGQTLGIIPQHMIGREAGRGRHGEMVVTENMHERKKVMFMNSDAILVLPGGAGSLDEFFEVLTWRQIGLHEKPIFLLNVEGYWDPLLRLIDHVIEAGFAEPTLARYSAVVPDVETLAARLRAALS